MTHVNRFSGRYKAQSVEGSGYWRAACDYMHLNPGRAWAGSTRNWPAGARVIPGSWLDRLPPSLQPRREILAQCLLAIDQVRQVHTVISSQRPQRSRRCAVGAFWPRNPSERRLHARAYGGYDESASSTVDQALPPRRSA